MRFLFFCIVLCLGIFSSCRNQAPSQAELLMRNFADFEDFYKRFHWDSTYQMQHIRFPLEGLPTDADSVTLTNNNYYWQREDWIIHRDFEKLSGDFVQEFVPFNDNVLMERIVHKTGTYGMIRRFAKLDGEWYLIYYAGLNRLAAPEGE